MSGFIQLHRKILNWEWFSDINTTHLFLYCLLRANHQDTQWKGIEIKKGSFLTSYQTLVKETGLSLRQCRTSLNHLKTTNELTHKTTSQYSIITVNNWNLYQANRQAERQTSDKQATTDNNDNNENKYIEYGEFKNVLLTDEQITNLKNIYSTKFNEAIEKLSSYIESTGKKYKSHYAVLNKNNWVYKALFNQEKKKKEEAYNAYA